MFDQAKMLLKARAIQSELKKTEIDAASRDDLVKVTVTGEMKLKSVSIDPLMLAPEKKAELERLVQTTISEAFQQAQQIAAEKTRDVMKDLGVNVPGM